MASQLQGDMIAGHRGHDDRHAAGGEEDCTEHGIEPDTLYFQAVADNVNLELEWLWLATQVTREEERRYCLERALYINPYSGMAQHELVLCHSDYDG
jgi:hypothetical protein